MNPDARLPLPRRLLRRRLPRLTVSVELAHLDRGCTRDLAPAISTKGQPRETQTVMNPLPSHAAMEGLSLRALSTDSVKAMEPMIKMLIDYKIRMTDQLIADAASEKPPAAKPAKRKAARGT